MLNHDNESFSFIARGSLKLDMKKRNVTFVGFERTNFLGYELDKNWCKFRIKKLQELQKALYNYCMNDFLNKANDLSTRGSFFLLQNINEIVQINSYSIVIPKLD